MQCDNQYLQIDTIKSILKHIIPWNDDFVKTNKKEGVCLNKKDIFCDIKIKSEWTMLPAKMFKVEGFGSCI